MAVEVRLRRRIPRLVRRGLLRVEGGGGLVCAAFYGLRVLGIGMGWLGRSGWMEGSIK